MQNIKTNRARHSVSRMAHGFLATCFAVIIMIATGCDSSSHRSSTTEVPQTDVGSGFLTNITAALSKGRYTLNNPWTQADLDFENISATITYQDIDGVGQWVRPFTTMEVEYEVRRRQCEEDYNKLYAPGTSIGRTFTDRRCYPTLEEANNLDGIPDPTLQRYGYYCGGGYPPFGAFTNKAPEPLDAVDYCCRLHDDTTWTGRGISSNECGIVMCLRQATVKGLAALPPNAEESRQHWYDGAASLCPGNQSNDARVPVGE